jgi:hypothetical protein
MDMSDEILVDSQTTPETVESSSPESAAPESLRDAVRAALDKARAPAEGDEGERAAADRARDDRGRFAAKPGEPPQTPAVADPQAQTEAVVFKPPAGWNAAAKAEFARLPPAVQESVAKREQEINRGFAVLADYKGLDEFTPLIKASGTTHAEVMRRALDWERSLKTNPVDTVLHVAKIAGVDLARLVGMQGQRGNQAPPQPQQTQAPAFDPRQVEALVQRTIAEREATSHVERFLSDPANVHAETVADHMAALISSGQAKDLQDAYDRACWSNPEIRATLVNQQRAPDQQTRNRQVADQARRAGRAISGAPSGRQSPSSQGNPASVMDAIKMAVAAQRDA